MNMRRVRQCLLALTVLLSFAPLVCGEDTESEAKENKDFASPDGRFAFRFSGKAEDENRTFDLIDKHSKKKLLRIAKEDADIGPSSRFAMEVLWRPDSKAFAVTETLWKRGSGVEVYLLDGSTFRKVKMPKLEADITDKMKGGKEFDHVVEISSQSPTEWRKDGSLVVEIESIQDGQGGTITVNRTVILTFRGGKAMILKSDTEFKIENQ